MTGDDRRTALDAFGFTPRQAAFLETAMVHAGVCVPRQYATFAGIVLGHTTRAFFQRLTTRRFATAYPCWQGTARVYHIHHKALYRAIGEADNRHRRPTTVARAVERLMVLDAVLADPTTTWLATEEEKVQHFVTVRGLDRTELPSVTFGRGAARTVRHFWHKRPIGLVTVGDRVVFLYIVTEPSGTDLRAFLDDHRPLLARLPRWTLRLCVPTPLASATAVHERVFTEFVGPPLRPAVLEEFRWFCQTRHALEARTGTLAPEDSARYRTARHAFGAPRFYDAYRRWRQAGDTVFDAFRSPRLHDAWQRGDIRWDIHALPHQYLHLAPVVATA